jgi:hypothetical protein
MTKWILEHKETISLLLVVLAALLLAIAIGGFVAFLSGFWLVASGSMDGMVITSWGY